MLWHDYVPGQLWKDRVAEQERKAKLEAIEAEHKKQDTSLGKKDASKPANTFLKRIGFI
ncbi:hypothetical protein [Paenibacillus sp. 1011MAR3C5]|uniref:hypothetical protein n=1 Tax=Paenibacillus sp. 1011MAR3C5 TaxID=1675787 RepID=UPI00160309D3|nr:hypothetical protein [Paenibacillus sp. 1011MAR3C5]